ncbi:MAG: Fic family protein [Nitrospirota bacterium]
MKKSGRYDTSALIEAQCEPGSHGRVLKNKLGIRSKRAMDKLEREEQLRAIEKLTHIYDSNHRFTAADVCNIHKVWLGKIYEWAGRYRQVNVSKGDFHFAAAAHVPKLMVEFEKGSLHKFTPCHFESKEKIIEALAVVHTELILIHPFREGNGRVARLLSILMGMQAGLPPLDFRGIIIRKNKEYISAIHAGMERNYEPMEKIFKSVICKTLRVRGQK